MTDAQVLAIDFGGTTIAMRAIGMPGGMSWESSAHYYRLRSP